MKQLATALLILVSVIPVLAGQHSPDSRSNVVKRGLPIATEAQAVTIKQLLETPDAYGKSPVALEGVVAKVCWIQGCWMNLSCGAGESNVRVTFKGFTVPRNSRGRQARILGLARVRT